MASYRVADAESEGVGEVAVSEPVKSGAVREYASEVRVGFAGADGVGQLGSLARFCDEPFERAAPVRKSIALKGQKTFTGDYWAATSHDLVGYESWVERDAATALDFDPAVVALASLPCRHSDRAILGNKLHHAHPRELVLRMDCADPPPAWRKLHGSLFRLATAGILHSEIRAGYGRVHQHRRAVNGPRAGVLPWSVRVGHDRFRPGEHFFLRRFRSQPSHEEQLLRQEARRCGFIGQDKRSGSL